MHPSFYSPTAEFPREDILADYERFLATRNGELDPNSGRFAKRESWLADTESWTERHHTPIADDEFESQYRRFVSGPETTEALLMLLGFVKVNANEAYGVDVVTRIRRPKTNGEDTLERLAHLVAFEEVYHTKILLGATKQFGVTPPRGAWTPPLPLRAMVGAIAYSPDAFFHPIVLGAEVGGLYAFNWMLRRVREVFATEPALKESMERRLIEVLIDEVGHVALNRMAVGRWGIAIAKHVAAGVVHAVGGGTPEFRALGWNREVVRGLDKFDWSSLPEEVRRRSFFA